jgi:hypothetical protein
MSNPTTCSERGRLDNQWLLKEYGNVVGLDKPLPGGDKWPTKCRESNGWKGVNEIVGSARCRGQTPDLIKDYVHCSG